MPDPETPPRDVTSPGTSPGAPFDDVPAPSGPADADTVPRMLPGGRRRLHRRLLTSAARPARPWLGAATLAAAAALGALVGFGLSDGASLARLGVVTLRLRGLPEFVSPDRGATGAALLGGLHVVFVSGAWGAGFGAVARWMRGRGVPPGVHEATLAALGLLLALGDGLLPRPLRLAAGALSGAERVLVALLVAGAAWGASRLSALPVSAPDRADAHHGNLAPWDV